MQTTQTKPGRPPGVTGIRAQAARHAKEAIQTLADVAKDAAAPADSRVEAARLLLQHAAEQKAA